MSLPAIRASLRRSIPNTVRNVQRGAPRASFRRLYSTEPTPTPKGGSSNTAIFVGLGAILAGGAAYYVFTSDDDAAKVAGTALKSGAQAAKVAANFVPSKADYQKVNENAS